VSSDPVFVPNPRPLKRQPLGLTVAVLIFVVWMGVLGWIYLNRGIAT
jgi:hypothetical protein